MALRYLKSSYSLEFSVVAIPIPDDTFSIFFRA
jgi:hypothetical protein